MFGLGNDSGTAGVFPLMPKYFFHVRHDTYLPDDEGQELPDKHAAWKEATIMAGRMLQGIDGKLRARSRLADGGDR